MLKWITLIIHLISCVVFAEYWLHGGRVRIVKAAVCAAAGLAVYAAAVFWIPGGRAFLAGAAAGLAAGLAYDRICRRSRVLLPEGFLYLGGAMVLLPVCLGGEKIWKYAVYFVVLLLCLSLLPGLRKDGRPTLDLADFQNDKKRYYWIISCLPGVLTVPEGLALAAVGKLSALSGMLLGAAFLFLYMLILWLQREIDRRFNAEYLNNAMNQWQRESRDYMNTIRAQRHDFNLHLHSVSGLINSGRYEECRQYVQGLVSEAGDVNDIMPVCDAVVGSMLYNMREEARRRGSDIFYRITYDMENILCNGFECNKIIGNLLQNAIDALRTPEDKAYGIRLSIFKRGGNTVIISENRFNGDPDRVARVFEPGYSTKKGHDGIGLSMILRTVTQYGGRVYPEFAEDRIRFIVNIPNKVSFSEGDETV